MKRRVLLWLPLMAGIVTLQAERVAAEVLITEEEASLPAPTPMDLTTRGITRGPKILILSPTTDTSAVKSPFNLNLKFEGFGGATIDPMIVKVIYVKNPAVDLTQRLKTHIKSDGINMENAEAPPGDHRIKIEIKDSEGRTGVSNFMLKVTK